MKRVPDVGPEILHYVGSDATLPTSCSSPVCESAGILRQALPGRPETSLMVVDFTSRIYNDLAKPSL